VCATVGEAEEEAVPLVLGVDSSLDATSVELRDSDDGRLYGDGRAAHPVVADVTEQDPAVWWQALVEARHDAGGALGVAAVSAAARQPGLVALDADGKLVAPARVGRDPDADPDAQRLERLLGRFDWVSACGSVPHDALTIVKLAQLRRTDPRAFDRIAWVMQPHDWLTFRLSRRVVTDRGDASSTGYWSPRAGEWRPDLLALVDDDRDWEACLPVVLEPHEAAGDREGVVIAPGTGQPMAIALGLGLVPGDVVLDTSGRVFAVRERPTEDPSGTVSGYADATGRFLPLVESVDAAGDTEAFARVLGLDRTRFDQLAQRAPPGAHGLAYVPAMGGHGGVLHGIRRDTEPEDIARAAVEGVACVLLDAVDALRSADVPVGGHVYLVGPATRSHALRQVVADLAQRPVSVPKGERAATGACVQAAAVLLERHPEEVAAAWGLGATREVEPSARVDGEEIRAMWWEARAATQPPADT
jgi:xylulokinase